MTTASERQPIREPGLGFGLLVFGIGFALFFSFLYATVTGTYSTASSIVGFLTGLALGYGIYLIIREARNPRKTEKKLGTAFFL